MQANNDIKAIIERAKTQLVDLYNGDCWVTDNFSKKVLPLESAEALKKLQGHSHSVAQLVGHITAWRNFAVQKLTGNAGYDIRDNSAEDWPDPTEWEAVRDDFANCHAALLAAIDNFPAEEWDSTVPGRSYSYLYLITGIIQHDYYHYGQIGSVIAIL